MKKTCSLFTLLIGFIFFHFQAVGQDGITVSGNVTDNAGNALVGANVSVLNTAYGAATDGNGDYIIEVPIIESGKEVTIRAEYIGYASQSVMITLTPPTVTQNFELSATALSLNEIVVTGTPGATRRRAIGNSVATLDVDTQVEQSNPTDIQSLLAGKVPGVDVQFGSGNLGTGGLTRVRGVASISLSNEPIVYIDGIRINSDPRTGPNIRGGRQVSRLNDLSPEDIARVEVIKGPAAATLYGTEASNGVIQIITKKGKTGAPKFNVEIKQGGNWFPNPETRLPTNYWINSETGQTESDNPVQRMADEGTPIFTTGQIQNYGASMRGGYEGGLKYYFSLGYDDEVGVLDYNWRKRYRTRLNMDYQLSEKFGISTNFGFVRNDSRLGMAASGWDIIGQIVWGSPRRLPLATNGFLRATPEAVGTIESKAEIDRFIWSFNLRHNPTSWLTQRLNTGVDIGIEENYILFPRDPIGSDFFFGGLSLGDKSLERRRSAFITVDYAAMANFNLTEDLATETSVGTQYLEKEFHVVNAQGRVFPLPSVNTVGGAATTFGGEDFIENKTFGVFVQERLSWKDRVYLTMGIRMDDNSAFGENFDFVTYPKLSAAWVVHEEPFWNMEAINSLRLRAAYGVSGQQPDVFAAVRLFTPTAGPGGSSTVTPTNIGNPDLKPERGEEIEIGFDAGLVNNRVNMEFTYFTRQTKDAIVNRTVSPSSGFPGVQVVNLGQVDGSGLEFAVNVIAIEKQDFSWDMSFTYSHSENEIVDLGGLGSIRVGANQEHKEGYPLAGYFFRKVVSASVDENGIATESLCKAAEGSSGTVPCSEAPAVFNGVPYPTTTAAFSNTLKLSKNIRVFALMDFKNGNHMMSGNVGGAHVLLRNSEEILKKGDRDPILAALDGMRMWRVAGFLDAGFLKLREVSVVYSVPDKIVTGLGLGVDGVQLTLSGRNLLTLWQAQKEIYGRPLMDPEMRLTSSEMSGYVQTVLPPMSQFFATVNINF